MKVSNSLTAVLTAVCNNSEAAFFYALLCGNFCNHFKNVSNNQAVFFIDTGCRCNVFFWNNKKMNGCLRVNIVECKNHFIFIYLICGDITVCYFTK